MENITFRPLRPEEYDAFLSYELAAYADSLCRDGQMTKEKAQAETRAEMEELLPQGLQTPQHFLCALQNDAGEAVGLLWYDLLGRSKCFIDDIVIAPAFRRQGYATAALKALENAVSTPHIALHIFDSNRFGRLLFEKSGYHYLKVEKSQQGSLYMFKRIR